MIIKYTKLLLVLLVLITSCKKLDPNKQIDEGKVEENVYTSEEIGWTIEIPNNWTVTSKAQHKEYQEKGLEAMEDVVGENLDLTGLQNLIGFRKNQFNVFQSTSEAFEIEYPGEWEENNNLVKKMIYTTYDSQGIKVDSTATKNITIDGLDFKTYEFTVYGPDDNVILNQLLYSRFINGYDFGVNINYNNKVDKKEMVNAWMSSKFKK